MKLVADTHVHLYPCYDLTLAFSVISRNLAALSSRATFRLACLTERVDGNLFSELKQKRVAPPLGFDIVNTREESSLGVFRDGKLDFLLLAGRQIATKERLEILCLGAQGAFRDGQPAVEVIKDVQNAGGLPVIAWSPGKWFFRRGDLVRNLLDAYAPGTIALGDTTLRPTLWATPHLMRYGRTLGHMVIAGTDPLPFSGEERMIATHGSEFDMSFDPDRPAQSFVKAFADRDVIARTVGVRSTLPTVVSRLRRHHRERRGI